MNPEVGTEAACSNVTLSGLRASSSWRTHTASAKAPPLTHAWVSIVSPNTGSPRRNRVTLLPTDSTIPATSVPGIGFLGLASPAPMRRRTYGCPVTTCHTSGWSEAALTRTRTSASPTTGSSTSRSSRSSGDPYRSWTIAFIGSPKSPAHPCHLRLDGRSLDPLDALMLSNVRGTSSDDTSKCRRAWFRRQHPPRMRRCNSSSEAYRSRRVLVGVRRLAPYGVRRHPEDATAVSRN